MNTNLKTIGATLIAFGAILLFILIFVKLNVDQEGKFLCQLVDESPDLSMDQCPAHENYNSWLLLVAFGITFIVIVGGVYLLMAQPKNNPDQETTHQEIDLSKLDEEEQKIVSLLQLNQGSKYQSDLIKETGLSKVKMSRLLDKLDGKKIIERKRRGMTNIVVLK